MRLVGVICEYNPFHLGHAYQLAEARRISGADAIVAVMSTSFTQRGEAALLSPAARAEMALYSGADVVFALPVLHAVRDAEHFARAGVAILAGLGCDAISFGAECDDLGLLQTIADLMETPSEAYQSHLHGTLRSGISHAVAVRKAMACVLPGSEEVLARPNNQLAIAYLRAIRSLHAAMMPVLIPRQSEHRAEKLDETRLPSAGAIRAAVRQGDWQAVRKALPEAGWEILRREAIQGHLPKIDALDAMTLYRLRTISAQSWEGLPGCSEGIEQRLRKAAVSANSIPAILTQAATRRYPEARFRRMLTHALLHMTEDDCAAEPLPTCARLLGIHPDVPGLTAQLRQTSFPLISGAADHQVQGERWLAIEERAMDVWALAAGLPMGEFWRQGVVRVG